MSCIKCNYKIREQDKYYHSSGICNIFICKVCSVCSHCHLGQQLDHKIIWDKDNYSEKMDIVMPIDTKRDINTNSIYDTDWR